MPLAASALVNNNIWNTWRKHLTTLFSPHIFLSVYRLVLPMHTYSHNYKLLGPAEIEGRQGWRNIHPKILPKSRGFGQYPVPRASRVPDSARNLIS